MNRRTAIGLGIGAALAIPAGYYWWNSSKLSEPTSFTPDMLSTLKKAVDVILPETDTPSASSLGVDKFIPKIVEDCYASEDQKAFRAGLAQLTKVKPEDLSTYLSNTEDPFLETLKKITIQGYTTSEYFMTEVMKYEFVPGRYRGCVTI